MNDKDLTKDEIKAYLKKYFAIFRANFKNANQKKLKFDYKTLHEMAKDCYSLMQMLYKKDKNFVSDISIKEFIPIVNLLIKIDVNPERKIKYAEMLKCGYKWGARNSLEHYMIYREWDESHEDKFFAPRYEIMAGYIHYLQEIATNPKFLTLIAMMPSGYGKTYPEKISEAWSLGKDPTRTILSICSNDKVVKGGSSLVMEEIKGEHFGEVFDEMAYNKDDKGYFLKETAEEWKLRDCKLLATYYTATTLSGIVGVRVSERIHIDDLYPDYKEAMRQELNEYYHNKNKTVWLKRFVQNKKPKEVITGTLWASGDFIARVVNDLKKQYKFHKSLKYKYVWVNDDESVAIVQVPALDYTTGLSTCPEFKSTKDLKEEQRTMDRYLWETNFQQIPTDPEDLFFSYGKLRKYTTIPATDYIGSYAVIDATRKSGKDYFSMPIFKKVPTDSIYDFYLKDVLFTKTATKDMYDDIVDKIIEHHIILLVIESNVTSELKQAIDTRLKQKGIFYCTIIEKYNNVPKKARIETEKSGILKVIVFPEKENYGVETDMFKFMDNLTTYNNSGHNVNDDAPDSLALFLSEIVEENSKPAKVEPLMGIREYI